MIIGLDVGGTHTDAVLIGNSGILQEIKIPTNTDELSVSILDALEGITQGIKNPKEISRIVLSTTLSTNAIVQNKLTPVAMIVSSGPGINPSFYQTSEDYYCVAGSIDHRGREILPINKKEIEALAIQIKDKNFDTVGIVSKFSTRNPKHEHDIQAILQPFVKHIFLGHEVSGNLDFPRRITTTFLNSAVHRIYNKFYEAINTTLVQKGLNVPIHILKADGGTMNLDSSIHDPSQTLFSGPAASVIGSIPYVPDGDVLVLDIGGTTTDISVLIDKVPLLDPIGIDISGYKTLIRSLNICSIGIGGDSYVRIENKELRVGPERVGSGIIYGGPEFTPTDAFYFLNAGNPSNPELENKLLDMALKLNLSEIQVAQRIIDLCIKNILNKTALFVDQLNQRPVYTVHEILEKYTISPRSIVILGGPALHFAKEIEKKSDLQVIIIPKHGIANAIGAALARTTCDVSFHADTEQGQASAPAEKFFKKIDRHYSMKDAIQDTTQILNKKAAHIGALKDDLHAEITEKQQFNMVRGFYSSGKNIRIKMQIQPGLLHNYQSITDQISKNY